MAKYYVDLPHIEAGFGAVMHCHEIIEAESLPEAQTSYKPISMNYSIKRPNPAILLPDHMQDWPREKILAHYARLHEKLGDEMFYRGVMHSMNPYKHGSALERLIERSKLELHKAKLYINSLNI